jgi:hypothetical protein
VYADDCAGPVVEIIKASPELLRLARMASETDWATARSFKRERDAATARAELAERSLAAACQVIDTCSKRPPATSEPADEPVERGMYLAGDGSATSGLDDDAPAPEPCASCEALREAWVAKQSARRVVTDWMAAQTDLVNAGQAPGWPAYFDDDQAWIDALKRWGVRVEADDAGRLDDTANEPAAGAVGSCGCEDEPHTCGDAMADDETAERIAAWLEQVTGELSGWYFLTDTSRSALLAELRAGAWRKP